MMDESRELILISKGNELAFDGFMDRHSQRMYNHAFGILGDRSQAEEIVSDVFLEVWKMRKKLLGIENIDSWLSTVVYRKSVSQLRKEARRRRSVSLDELPNFNFPQMQSPMDSMISEEEMAKAYDDENPYVNRDPRFYRDIIYHGAMFKGQWINTATGADAINAANSTTTGYFTHKYLDGYYTKGMSGDWAFDGILIRLGTIYLVYAESVTRSKGATEEVYNMLNELRARSFMAPIPPAAKTNKELLLDYILRERRVELYHEKSRFFSTRFYLEPTSDTELAKESQWNSLPGTNDEKAQQYFAKYGAYPKTQHRICGMRPVEDPNGKIEVGGKKYRMERFWKEDRVFLEKHYLFPIPTEELQRANIPQNPNW